MTKIIESKVILIEVSAYWEIRSKSWDKNKVTDRKYIGKFHGGWNITACKGHPEINGGMGTPDMMALFPTVYSIKQKFLNEYQPRYPKYKVIVKLKIIKDDRNPTMESFF